MNYKFWKKKIKISVYHAIPTSIGESENVLDMKGVSDEEYNYLINRFGETIKNLIYMTLEERIRVGLDSYRKQLIHGQDRISIIHQWGVIGNDLIMWLGEFRRKGKELN